MRKAFEFETLARGSQQHFYFRRGTQPLRDFTSFVDALIKIVKDETGQDVQVLWRDHASAAFVWDVGFAHLDESVLNFYTTSLSLRDQIESYAKRRLRIVNVGRVHMLLPSSGGVELRNIGSDKSTFQTGNYTPEVVDAFNYIAANIGSRKPKGRLVILNGQPGTGKTHLIRGLLNKVRNVEFVLVQADMIGALAQPSQLQAFVNLHNRTDHPIILIVEDADECLIRREEGNLSHISALLNLSDGLLGKLLDLRIICTTNADRLDLDPAVIRGGRLLKYQNIGPIPKEQALKVYTKLGGKSPDEITGPLPLGDVYQLALNPDWDGPAASKAKGRVGF